MDWYAGTIESAIKEVREKSKLLLALIVGVDDVSKKLESHFDEQISRNCTNIVCIRMEASSTEAAQFSAVYALLTVPCVYLIKPSGQVVDIKLGLVDKADLSSWIEHHSGQFTVVSNQTDNQQPSTSASTIPVSDTASTSGSTSAREEGATVGAGKDNREEHVQQAYEVIEVKRQQRQEAEKKKAVNSEIERRTVGKGMQNFKQQKHDRELEEALAERKKAELESREARERVLRAIAEDRQEKLERDRNWAVTSGGGAVAAKQSVSTPTATTLSSVAPGDGMVLLRLRFSTCAFLLSTRLPVGATLAGDLRSWVEQTAIDTTEYLDAELRTHLIDLIRKGYSIRLHHPAKLYTPEEETQSLGELGLYPSACLFLVPSGRNPQVLRWLYSPYTEPLFYLYGVVNSAAHSVGRLLSGVLSAGTRIVSSLVPSSSASTATSPPRRDLQQRSSSSAAEDEASGSRTGSVRRKGNMARLSHQPDSSDDEQARWNGNSTQQL